MGNSKTRRKASRLRREQIQAKMLQALPARSGPPRFVADVMLGKLAKWLRIAGYDVLYSNKYSDDELISISREQGRILLSLDSRLLVRKPVDFFIYLQPGNLESQIRRILELTHTVKIPAPFSRCLSCNVVLSIVPAETVRNRIPEYVYRTHTNFKLCPECGKIFWSGTHRKSVMRYLERLLPASPGERSIYRESSTLPASHEGNPHH
ncbi:MAG: Mut7-C RNAse domain-containing protein [Acidobacteriota bacterium]